MTIEVKVEVAQIYDPGVHNSAWKRDRGLSYVA